MVSIHKIKYPTETWTVWFIIIEFGTELHPFAELKGISARKCEKRRPFLGIKSMKMLTFASLWEYWTYVDCDRQRFTSPYAARRRNEICPHHHTINHSRHSKYTIQLRKEKTTMLRVKIATGNSPTTWLKVPARNRAASRKWRGIWEYRRWREIRGCRRCR